MTIAKVDIATYLRRKDELRRAVPRARPVCYRCHQAGFGCYCEFVRPFESKIHFVILIHPIEVKRRIATGRMAHLCLQNSTLIEGQDFSENERVRQIVANDKNHCVVLYPGRNSVNLSQLTMTERAWLVPNGKALVVFVIDGTWNTAGRMIRNRHLLHLPRISFEPGGLSRFRVRRQPAPEFLSTIEAIHRTIDLFDESGIRDHDNLLTVFDQMVEFQLRFTAVSAEV